MSAVETTFYSHGKLLISGEYFVLDGAQALAVPTRFGQSLKITQGSKPGELEWYSYDHKEGLWMMLYISLETLEPVSTPDNEEYKYLLITLQKARELNPGFLPADQSFSATSQMEFPRDWGLGSSSTLVNNIAQWAQVDPFELYQLTFGGSGYDIACASADDAILYRLEQGKPTWQAANFNPSFSENLYLVHLGQKQDSRKGIELYRQKSGEVKQFIPELNELTEKMRTAEGLYAFRLVMDKHEELVSSTLGLTKVKNRYFADFQGSVKSLGAWGGDFALAASHLDYDQIMKYFEAKGFTTVVPWHEMVLNNTDEFN